MITKFKLFESRSIEEDLIDTFDDQFIEDYFDENYNEDEDIIELISMFPNKAIESIDSDDYVQEWIDNDINSLTLEDYGGYDLKEYINEHLTNEKEEKIIEFYKEINDVDDIKTEIDGVILSIKNIKKGLSKITIKSDDGENKIYDIPEDYIIMVGKGDSITIDDVLAKNNIEYDDSMIDELSEEQLREVIEADNEADECVEYIVHSRYDNSTAQELIEEIYGSLNRMNAKDIYNIIGNYIDEDAFRQEIKEGWDFEYKKEHVKYKISYSKDLQQTILDNDAKNIIQLADLLKDNNEHSNDISDELEFQKTYIEQYVIANRDETSSENEIRDLIEEALDFLNNNFDINSELKDIPEYEVWFTMKQYNL